MTFTNITNRGIYLQCCHREVEPGGSFQVPWERARRDRGLRAAMNGGTLSWESGPDEVRIPGSPAKPDFEKIRKEKVKAEKDRAEAAGKARQAREKAANAGMSDNMSRMGSFDVPQPARRESRTQAVRKEKPVTKADVISGGKPKSLADIRRHNKAVKAFGGK